MVLNKVHNFGLCNVVHTTLMNRTKQWPSVSKCVVVWRVVQKGQKGSPEALMFLELEKEFVFLWVLCSIVRSATSIDMEQKEWELYVPTVGVWTGECGMYRVRVTPTPGARPSAHPWDPRVSSREVLYRTFSVLRKASSLLLWFNFLTLCLISKVIFFSLKPRIFQDISLTVYYLLLTRGIKDFSVNILGSLLALHPRTAETHTHELKLLIWGMWPLIRAVVG